MNGIRLKNEYLSVLVYPERGGKTASVSDPRRSFELLYQPREGYPPLRPGMPFSEGDASGFDDVFPSMGEQWHPDTGSPVSLPDHGEIWTSRMTVEEADAGHVRMRTSGHTFPFLYEKEILLRDNTVRQRVTVTNRGTSACPALWICHCLMRLEPGMRFSFPARSEGIECVPGCSWPPEGKEPTDLKDLQVVPPAGTMMKFWFRDPVRAGECKAMYPGGVQAILRFSPEQLPYLGFWITNGGYRGEFNFAFEPASGYCDTLGKAAETGTLPLLEPGERKVYETEIELLAWQGKPPACPADRSAG